MPDSCSIHDSFVIMNGELQRPSTDFKSLHWASDAYSFLWWKMLARFGCQFLLVRIVGGALHSFHAHFLLERYDEHLKESLGRLNNIQPEIVEYETTR